MRGRDQDRVKTLLKIGAALSSESNIDLLLEMMQTIPEAGVGASRQRVHLELQNLRDAGELDLGYRKIIIRPLFFERTPLPPR